MSEKYSLVPEDASDEASLLSDSPFIASTRSRRDRTITKVTLGLCLLLSLSINLYLYLSRGVAVKSGVTQWAGLEYNVPTPIYSSTEYGFAIGTEEERDRRWAALDISEGVIALPDAEAQRYGLPASERFPWDQSKGVYLLGAHHDIHCLKNIYKFVSSYHKGITPNLTYSHIVHCLDTLLQDVYCHADDTPWMQLPPAPFRAKYPEYQLRQCRSWDKMMEWAHQYNACYQNENIVDSSGHKTDDPFEHFHHCPSGSQYSELMERFFAQKDAGANPASLYEAYRMRDG